MITENDFIISVINNYFYFSKETTKSYLAGKKLSKEDIQDIKDWATIVLQIMDKEEN